MRIVIAGSMHFAEKMMEAKRKLEKLGHTAVVSKETESLLGMTDVQKEDLKLKQKFEDDAIRGFWNLMEDADALLVLNYDKNGIENYVGGNALMDIALAYYKNQKIFFMNPIPEISHYKSEMKAIKPVIINGDYSQIK